MVDPIESCALPPVEKVDEREWWLWGLAITVTLVLVVGILSLAFPGFVLSPSALDLLNLREWIRALAALVLLFDIHTVYQHLQIQRIRRRLAQRDRLFQLITESAADMIAVIDGNGKRLYNSPAYHKILGYSPEDLAATSSLDQVHPDDRSRVLEAADKARATGRGERLEYRFRHKDGSWRVLESTASPIPGPEGKAEGLVIVNRDVTDRVRALTALAHHTLHDHLTELPNRALFLDRLRRAIVRAERHPEARFAVLFLDVDEFRVFNDSLGHRAGDDLLRQLAKRLTSCLRDSDTIARVEIGSVSLADSTVARIGGDEFTVLVEDLHNASDAIRIAERVQRRLAVPFSVGDTAVSLSTSVGIAFPESQTYTAEDLLRDAEIAMYRAKQRGRAGCEIFDNAMHVTAIERLQLETDLRRAVELGEFETYYQPIIDLSNGRVVSVEALSRWQRPAGITMPAEFIELADATGLILPLNRQLLREACLQLKSWHLRFPSDPPLRVSVNLTPRQFAQEDLCVQFRKIFEETSVDPRWVDLEITETIAMADVERSTAVLAECTGLGVGISIDDFGTGYSSLSRLKHFSVNTLKIDRSFISAVHRDPDAQEIVRAIVLLAHNLGLKVVGEGVETEEQEEFLRGVGCDFTQGFLYSRPAKPEMIEHLLTESSAGNRNPREICSSVLCSGENSSATD
jgi:diguanylate cyclase (GGDEF)-like protein/PAS domain S-box-containing protein